MSVVDVAFGDVIFLHPWHILEQFCGCLHLLLHLRAEIAVAAVCHGPNALSTAWQEINSMDLRVPSLGGDRLHVQTT